MAKLYHYETTISGKVIKLREPKAAGGCIMLTIDTIIGNNVLWEINPKKADFAKKALGNKVVIYGVAVVAKHDKDGIIRPIRIRMNDADTERTDIITPAQSAENHKKLMATRGSMPNLTGGKDTVEYLRELRGDDDD
ncbi:MAG: hypothetical protein ACR2PR_09400 [Pseudohongiellaceae bacterium]